MHGIMKSWFDFAPNLFSLCFCRMTTTAQKDQSNMTGKLVEIHNACLASEEAIWFQG